MAELGLLFLLAGWLMQLWKVYRGSREIGLRFMGLYSIGAMLLAGANFEAGQPVSAWLNILLLLPIAFIIFWKR